MDDTRKDSVIGPDTVIEGQLRGNGRIVIVGRVQGDISTQSVLIDDAGAVYGALRAEDAEVNGTMQGDVYVRGLIRIGSTGTVAGDVEYDKIAMEQGGTLSATLRNVPPHLAGDLELSVRQGGTVRITTVDLTAFDPDDAAEDLTYRVSNASGGFVAFDEARDQPVTTFTQADLEKGRILFVHDGGAPSAGFEVVVADAKGATSGRPQHVTVTIKG